MRLSNLLLAIIAALAPAFTAVAAANPATDILALKGATIYTNPTAPPIRKGVILIKDGVITAVGRKGDVAIPRGAQTLNLKGAVVTAGLWNSHVHFFERKWADAGTAPAEELEQQLTEMLTRFGFTSVFDVTSDWQNTKSLRDRIENGEIDGPRIRSTGKGLVAPGALPSDQVLNIMGLMKAPLPEISGPEHAQSVVNQALDEGAVGVKLFAGRSGAPMPEGVIDAAIKETHRRGKPIFFHPNNGEDVLAALNAGADVIAHTTPHAGSWSEAILVAVRGKRPALTPTLSLWTYYARHDRTSTREQIAETATEQLRGWIAAGGIVLFGTDSGANQYDPMDEYKLMAKAGMSFPDILASLTSAPADFFGESNRLGAIEVGREADLVVFASDPAEQISALGDIRFTLRSGKIIYEAPTPHR